MFSTYKTPEYDYLVQERVDALLKYGYRGFKISKITGHSETGQYRVEAANNRRVTLTSIGDTKEDACKKLIDLIDVTAGDF
jgi:hypothetical protein